MYDQIKDTVRVSACLFGVGVSMTTLTCDCEYQTRHHIYIFQILSLRFGASKYIPPDIPDRSVHSDYCDTAAVRAPFHKKS